MGESVAWMDDILADASSILLLAPSGSDPESTACIDLLTFDDLGSTNVLSVTLDQAPCDRLSLWHREVGSEWPNRTVVVGESREPRPDEVGVDLDTVPSSLTTDSLPENAEPIDLAVATARYLGAWESAAARSVCCLHSLTAVLERFDRAAVVSLVTSLNRLCGAVDATVHHHMDPMAHDDEILSTFRPLYDAVVEYVPETGWTVTNTADRADRPTFRRSTTPPGGRAGVDVRPETIPMPYSFDQTFDLVSVPRRRTLLYHLKDQESGTLSLEELVEAVARRERAIPARETPESTDAVRVSLVHSHVPKLADLGILEYDTESSTIEYHANPALESFLRYMETLELG
jgi:hypothetical protein